MRNPIYIFFIVLALAGCSSQQKRIIQSIGDESPQLAQCRKTLLEQQTDWNRGDLDAFVTGYYHSKDTVFSSTSGTHVGYESMVERYRTAYPTPEKMGRLEFLDVTLNRFGLETVKAEGSWKLAYEDSSKWGRFLLIMRPFPKGCKIVLDYTTKEGERSLFQN